MTPGFGRHFLSNNKNKKVKTNKLLFNIVVK